MSEKQVSLGMEDLKEVIAAAVAAAVAESRKPAPPTVAELEAERVRQEQRLADGQAQRDAMQARADYQKICSHLRPNGSASAVFVKDDLGGYFLCQHQQCMARIRPSNLEDRLRKVDASGTTYDTGVWNRLMQAMQQATF